MTDDEMTAIERLTKEVETLNKHRFVRVHNSMLRMIGFQFVRGLALGLGTAVGATALVSVVAYWLSQFEFVPIIGEWVKQIADQIQVD